MNKALLKISIVAGLLFTVQGSVQAGPASDFYHGKTLTIVVPYSTGGGFDTVARRLGRYMERYLDVADIRVVNKTGGGGLVGANTVYDSSPDGLTVGLIDYAGSIFAQILERPGVQFDMTRYTLLGTPNFAPRIILSRADSDFQSFADVLHASRPVTMLATGQGGADYQLADLVLTAFDIPHQMVAAFHGQHGLIATFLSGQGDFINTSPSHTMELGDEVNALLVEGDSAYPRLPDVPVLTQAIDSADIDSQTKTLLDTVAEAMFTDVLLVGPPGLADARARALRTALRKTVADPEYQAAARKVNEIPRYTSGADMGKALATVLADSAAIRALLTRD